VHVGYPLTIAAGPAAWHTFGTSGRGAPVSTEVETKSVELTEIEAGVHLHAGHPVVLVVNGLKGRKRYLKDAEGENAAAGDRALEPGTPGGTKDGAFAIELQLHAAGGTPLAHERVRIHDPDTGQQVGEPAVTDENGVLKARVPADKEYEIHLDADASEEHPDAFGEQDHPLAAQLPHPDEHAVLHVAFLDAKDQPLKGEPVKVKDEHGQSQEVKTDERGQFELVVDHGPFTLEARGASFLAHSVLSGDLGEQGAPYRFVVS